MDDSLLLFSEYMLLAVAVVAAGGQVWRLARREKDYSRLKWRLRRLRLSKMLDYVGADMDTYVRAVPARDLDAEIRKCAQCRACAICDACVRDGKLVVDMHFCPVYRSLTRHSKAVAARRSLL